MRQIFFAIFILTITLNASAQKAYDRYFFTGKVQGFTVKFEMTYGYVEASKLKLTNIKTKKTIQFLENGVSDDHKMTFLSPTNESNTPTHFFISDVKNDYTFGSLPTRLNCVYIFKDETYNATLTKMK